MRAQFYKLTGTLFPLLLAMAACTDDPTTTIQAIKNVVQAASATPSVAPSSGSAVFGAGTIRHTGLSGLVNRPIRATDPPRSPGTYRAQVTLSIKGLPPGSWTDARLVNQDPPLEIKFTPQNPRTAPGSDRLRSTGVLVYPTLAEGGYHFLYHDPHLVSAAQPNASGDTHIDMVGFYVSDLIPIYEQRKPADGVFRANLDLYWDSQSFPYKGDPSSGVAGSPARLHLHGEYITYSTDRLTVKAFNTPSPAQYRFVVYPPDGTFRAFWYSAWHDPDSNGIVQVNWNGYTNDGETGYRDAPDENLPGNVNLPAGDYLYAIEFKKAGLTFPENAADPRLYNEQDPLFINNFYGGSQLFPLRLVHGTKPAGTPAPSASPTSTPTPVPAPTLPLFPTFPPFN